MSELHGVPASPSGSHASHEAANASSPAVSIPNAYLPKAYVVLSDRVLGSQVCALVGDVVYDQRGYDYGLSSDDTRFTGIEHISVTRKSDGGYPGFTIPRADLEPISRAAASAIEARRAETQGGSVHESASPEWGDAQ